MGSAREGPENDFLTIFPSNTELAGRREAAYQAVKVGEKAAGARFSGCSPG